MNRSKKTVKSSNRPVTLERLLEIADPAWPIPQAGDRPPTVESLVECLKNVACNRLDRIRDLEDTILRLFEFRRRI
jgi:hypothetical protein